MPVASLTSRDAFLDSSPLATVLFISVADKKRMRGDVKARTHTSATEPCRRGQCDDESKQRRGHRSEYCGWTCCLRRLDAAFDCSFQTDGGRQRVDDCQSERQHLAILLLRRFGTELPSIWPLVYVGIRAARMSVERRSLAVADRRRMASAGAALWWTWKRFA